MASFISAFLFIFACYASVLVSAVVSANGSYKVAGLIKVCHLCTGSKRFYEILATTKKLPVHLSHVDKVCPDVAVCDRAKGCFFYGDFMSLMGYYP